MRVCGVMELGSSQKAGHLGSRLMVYVRLVTGHTQLKNRIGRGYQGHEAHSFRHVPPLRFLRHRHGVPSRTSGPNSSPGLRGPAVRSRPRSRPQLRSPDSGSTHPSMSQNTDQASQSTGWPTRRCDFTRIGKHTDFVSRYMHFCITKNRFMLALLKRETTQSCPRHQ